MKCVTHPGSLCILQRCCHYVMLSVNGPRFRLGGSVVRDRSVTCAAVDSSLRSSSCFAFGASLVVQLAFVRRELLTFVNRRPCAGRSALCLNFEDLQRTERKKKYMYIYKNGMHIRIKLIKNKYLNRKWSHHGRKIRSWKLGLNLKV